MLEFAPGWTIAYEERSEWLCAHLKAPAQRAFDTPPLAEHLWGILTERNKNHLVLDLSEIPLVSSWLIGQLVMVHRRLTVPGGVMRLVGMSADNQSVLRVMGLEPRFPLYATTEDALLGHVVVR